MIVTHGGTEIGQGANTVFCQMAAEELGLPYEDIIQGVSDSDTDDLRFRHVRRPMHILGRQCNDHALPGT